MAEECDATWRGLPLANPVAADAWNPAAGTYWGDEVLPQLIPALVFCSLAAAMLLGFLGWRLALCCGARRKGRRSECSSGAASTEGLAVDSSSGEGSGEGQQQQPKKRRGCCSRRGRRDPADVLRGRAYWAIKILAVLLMGGVVAGAALGIAAVQPSLVKDGRSAFNSAQDYINGAIQAANATVAVVQEVDSWVLGVQVKLHTLNISSDALATVDKTIQGVHDTIQTNLGSVRSALGYIQVKLADQISHYELEWSATVSIIDYVRQGALYAMYGCLIGFVVLLAAGILANMPGLASPALVLCLILLLVAWALVGASTAGLKVGNDGCENIDQLVTDALRDVAEGQVASGGSGIFARAGVNNTVALVQYFLTGQGKNVTQIIQETTGLNINELLSLANQTAAMVQGLVTNPNLVRAVPGLASLVGPVDQIVDGVTFLVANTTDLVDRLSYGSFGPVYNQMKDWACCDALNWVAAQWTALLVAGCCLVVMAGLSFWWIARMDLLESRGCWHVYRLRDYCAMEDEEGGAGQPSLPSFKQSSEDKDIALSTLVSTKEAAVAAKAAKGKAAADEIAAVSGDGFSLRAVVPPPALPPYSEDMQLLSARSASAHSTPAAGGSSSARRHYHGAGGASSSVQGGGSSCATTPRDLPAAAPFSAFSSEPWQPSPAPSRRGGWSQWNTPHGK